GNLADGEAFLEAGAGTGDADAFIGLHAGAGAFGDANLHAHGVAGLEFGELALFLDLGGLLGLELTDDVHRFKPLLSSRQPERPALASQLPAAGLCLRPRGTGTGANPPFLLTARANSRPVARAHTRIGSVCHGPPGIICGIRGPASVWP